MLIYLATRFENQKNLIAQRPKVEAIGHKVTSRWLNDEAEDCWRDNAQVYSEKDFEDIDASDMFLLDMTCDLDGAKGGHFVELGYAIKGQKLVWIIGKQPNVFCYHKNVRFFKDWKEVYEALEKLPCEYGVWLKQLREETVAGLSNSEKKHCDDE
jgi:nucleoside 2-deoxyribosyltransferase